jgi:hypothetical protein
MNGRMTQLLPTLPKVGLTPDVESTVRSGFVERDGCLLLLELADSVPGGPGSFPDLTGYEAVVNQIHLHDFSAVGLETSAASGVLAVEVLGEQIEAYAGAGPVQIALSVGFHDIPSVVIRFYRRRPGEMYLSDDLNAYESEALLIRDVG